MKRLYWAYIGVIGRYYTYIYIYIYIEFLGLRRDYIGVIWGPYKRVAKLYERNFAYSSHELESSVWFGECNHVFLRGMIWV